jgi:uncharacterized alkaline shock family protein YloU
MEGHSHIADDVLARYAGDAAKDVPGVTGLVGRHAVRVESDRVELRLGVEWGASIPAVAEAVQGRVAEYLARMADVRPAVDVVVEEVG